MQIEAKDNGNAMKQTGQSTFEKVYQMPLGKVYPLLVNKATRKGRTREEVNEIICWLTGYSPLQLAELLQHPCLMRRPQFVCLVSSFFFGCSFFRGLNRPFVKGGSPDAAIPNRLQRIRV